MLIKDSKESKRLISKIKKPFIWLVAKKRVLLVIYSLLIFLLGITAHKEDIFERIKETRFYGSARRPQNFLKGLIANPEHISIDIKYEDFQKLAYKREVALQRRILISSPDDYVSAKIRYKNRGVKAKIRLKGDMIDDQLQGEKWSFRIVIKGEDALFGMKVFSIHAPPARNYAYEWLFHEAM